MIYHKESKKKKEKHSSATCGRFHTGAKRNKKEKKKKKKWSEIFVFFFFLFFMKKSNDTSLYCDEVRGSDEQEGIEGVLRENDIKDSSFIFIFFSLKIEVGKKYG